MKALKLDAHQHFWTYHPEKQDWINEDMQAIRRDFFPADLLPLLQESGIDGCIAVQADQTEAETDFLIGLAAEHDFIKAVIGWVDLRSPDIESRLSYYKQFPVVKGFRHVLQGESPEFMLHPDFLRGIALLEKYDYCYEILIFPHHLKAALELVQRFPNQRFIIDHLAKPYIKDQQFDTWTIGMKAIAAAPNVYCKISGMVTEADWKNWRYEDFLPCMNTVVEAFGMDRIVYGSDWPVCLVAASYDKMIGIVRRYFEDYSSEAQAGFFGRNACHFYQL